MTITRWPELRLAVEQVCDLKARPIMSGFGRPVAIEFAPGSLLHYARLGRGTGGQIQDAPTGVRFDGEGRSVLHGPFDFGPGRVKRHEG